jgi:rubrerythrin
MDLLGEEQIQLGKVGVLTGHWSNLLAGALEAEIWECPACGKIEFFRQGTSGIAEGGGHISQLVCPKCGGKYDFDTPKCPHCGAVNSKF